LILVDLAMGNTLNSVEHLGAPFRSVDEQVFVIPRDGRHEIANRFFKIIFMLEGSCLHEVDDEPVPFESGDVIVIPRVGCQRYLAAGPRTPRRVHALRLIFDLPALTAGQRRLAVRGDVEMDLASFVRHHLHEVRHLPQGQDEFVRPLLTELRQEAEQRRAGYRFRVTALCSAITVHLIRRLNQPSLRTVSKAADSRRRPAFLVLQAKEYLLKNLKEDLRLDQVAWHLRVSAEHLARAFKQETGQTVFTHLQHLRLEQAKTCLIGSELSITAIAGRTGFNSVAHFSRSFKDYCGVSPLAYRRERWNRATENVAADVAPRRRRG
jgi:AraC-like DNA-binding protein